MTGLFKDKAPYIFVVATAFVLFQLYILLDSIPSIYRMYTITFPSRIETDGTFRALFWFLSEFTAEIGLAVRVVSACLFAAFALTLLRKKEFPLTILRKAVLLQGISYLSYVPFIAYYFTTPMNTTGTLIAYYEVAISYGIQTILVFSSLIVLYVKVRRPKIETAQLFKWGAIAVVSNVFALWVKHFFFNLYALPIDLADPVLFAGLFNSTLTMLVSALVLLVAFVPVIRGKTTSFNSRAVGVAFIWIGLYFVFYILVALVNPGYMAFLPLTELWAITFLVLGAGFLIGRNA